MKALFTRTLSGLHHGRQLPVKARALFLTCVAVGDVEEGQASALTTSSIHQARTQNAAVAKTSMPRKAGTGRNQPSRGIPTAVFRSFSLTLTSVVVRAFICFVQVSRQTDTRLVHCLPVTRHQRSTQLTPQGNVQKMGVGWGLTKYQRGVSQTARKRWPEAEARM